MIRAVEFFSGIGGLHYGLSLACPDSKVVAAFDVNPNANAVYRHNFKGVPVSSKDIKGLKASFLDSLNANMWLLSPPCQPYSRRGKKRDVDDPRALGFLHLIRVVLPKVARPPEYILIENVEGFENSETHKLLLVCARRLGYSFREFILSPHNFGVPYKRDRYFFIARRIHSLPDPHSDGQLLKTISEDKSCVRVNYVDGTCAMGTEESATLWRRLNSHCKPLRHFLEQSKGEQTSVFSLPDKVLRKSATFIDIVSGESKHCCCFTKSYTGYARGSGSVLQTCADPAKHPIRRDPDYLRSLHLRYFSPREVANLHGFPQTFAFPSTVTRKQRYGLLGNSLSITVVAALLRQLLTTDVADGGKGTVEHLPGRCGSRDTLSALPANTTRSECVGRKGEADAPAADEQS